MTSTFRQDDWKFQIPFGQGPNSLVLLVREKCAEKLLQGVVKVLPLQLDIRLFSDEISEVASCKLRLDILILRLGVVERLLSPLILKLARIEIDALQRLSRIGARSAVVLDNSEIIWLICLK